MKIKDYVKLYDPQNQFKVLADSWKQIEFALNNQYDLTGLKGRKYSSIIITGLGGSAISGDIVENYLSDELKFPMLVNRSYSLPSYAGQNTLVIASSYSGNTEETISVLELAIERGCPVLVITTGGKAMSIAESNNIPVIKLQPGFQPRYALGLSLFSLIISLEELCLIKPQKDQTERILKLWKEKSLEYSADANIAFNTALSLIGYIPIIYSVTNITSAAGYRFKCQLNENSKVHAFHNVLPEMNHNEIIGWETYNEKTFPAKIVLLSDDSCHPQITKRFNFLTEIFEQNKIDVINLKSSEINFKARLMDLIYLCDWITFFLSVQRGYDPSEINYINQLKERL